MMRNDAMKALSDDTPERSGSDTFAGLEGEG